MATKSYPLRIPEEIIAVSKIRAEEEHLDSSTALRQFLYRGAEEYILRLVEKGRLSTNRAAEILGVTTYDIHLIAQKNEIKIGSTLEQSQKSRDTAKKMFK